MLGRERTRIRRGLGMSIFFFLLSYFQWGEVKVRSGDNGGGTENICSGNLYRRTFASCLRASFLFQVWTLYFRKMIVTLLFLLSQTFFICLWIRSYSRSIVLIQIDQHDLHFKKTFHPNDFFKSS